MPDVTVVFYCDENGRAPVLEWLDQLPEKVQNKCIERVQRLAEKGHELRRPLADYLRDDIYELRIRRQRVNYRILYTFVGDVAVLLHGLKKEKDVLDRDIDLAVRRREMFSEKPAACTFREGGSDEQEA